MQKANQEIVVIDYGMGNIGSISNMLKYLGTRAVITADPAVIAGASKLILPGVGHFDRAMANIRELNLHGLIRQKALDEKIPMLGICLGMQIMCDSSEEGTAPGLSLVNASVRKFTFPEAVKLKVPHMGWNNVRVAKETPFFKDMHADPRFYFVHSYFVECKSTNDVLTYSEYGHDFVSAFQKDNIIGVQFHPEKSHKFGIKLFKNFIEHC